MLKQLFIQNFVLIESLSLSLEEGFGAFTGETGAGKSILIDAISLLCGARGSATYIRHGCTKAVIEGVFQLDSHHPAYEKIIEYGFELEDNACIFTRELYADGRSVARIQNRQCSLAIVKEICSTLVDIHSQHDNTYLLDPKHYLSLLDQFHPNLALQTSYQSAYVAYASLKKEYDTFLTEHLNEAELDVLHYQKNEIEQASIRLGELEELEEQVRYLSNIEKIQAKASVALTILQEEPSMLDQLYKASQSIASIHEIDTFAGHAETLDSLYYQLQDVSDALVHALSAIQSDEQQLNRIQERLFLLNRLKRKYGGNEASILRRYEDIMKQIDQIEHRQEYMDEMETKLGRQFDLLMECGKEWSTYRRQQALALEQSIQLQLMDLFLPNARFHIEFDEVQPTKWGIDGITFLVAMNKGEQLKPLDKTASGGEISRFMLGLKVIFTRLEQMATVIFDEIDTGISGPTAFAIGKKMRQLSKDAQVFAVTHLAQVAASANAHYYIEKYEQGESTLSQVSLLTGEERMRQLALLANGNISSASVLAAKELYKTAQSN